MDKGIKLRNDIMVQLVEGLDRLKAPYIQVDVDNHGDYQINVWITPPPLPHTALRFHRYFGTGHFDDGTWTIQQFSYSLAARYRQWLIENGIELKDWING